METHTLDFSITNQELLLTMAVGVGVICYLIYYFITHAKSTKEYFFRTNEDEDVAWTNYIFFSKVFGFVMLGLVPITSLLLVFPELSFKYFGIYFNSKTALFSVVCILALWVPIVTLTYFYTKNPDNHHSYPQIRASTWTRKRLFISLFGWFIYTLGYEFLFRGVMFIPLVQIIGMWPAIVINIALYSISHIPKGIQDVMGTIVMGILLCLLTLKSGTIWISFFAHVSIGLTSTIVGIKFNEGMQYVHKK